MMMLAFTSLTLLIHKLQAKSLLSLLTGCSRDSLPPLGSYFVFMAISSANAL